MTTYDCTGLDVDGCPLHDWESTHPEEAAGFVEFS